MDININGLQEKISPIINGEEVVFIYHGKAETVFLAGDYNRWELKDRMLKLPDRDLWFIKKNFPYNSRFDYKYIVDGNWITDPLNENRTPGGSGDNSTLIMPGYKSNYKEIIDREVPRGTVITNLEYPSNNLGVGMRYHIYLPFNYKKEEIHHILYALDGSDYLNFSKIHHILDVMIHEGKLPKVVAILADPHDRTREYTLYKPYYNYIIQELMPFVEHEYLSQPSKIQRSVIGVSWGGLTAIYLAAKTPGTFSRVLSQSGSFWPRDWLIFDMVKRAKTPPIHFCLQTGTIEDTEEMNDAMAELLQEKGYSLNYVKYAETHSWYNWKGHLDEGLRELYSNVKSKGPEE